MSTIGNAVEDLSIKSEQLEKNYACQGQFETVSTETDDDQS